MYLSSIYYFQLYLLSICIVSYKVAIKILLNFLITFKLST